MSWFLSIDVGLPERDEVLVHDFRSENFGLWFHPVEPQRARDGEEEGYRTLPHGFTAEWVEETNE